MDRNLDMPPKAIKPYRDYLDRDYIKEESPTCAAVTYTMDKLTMEDTSVKFEGFTETFNMTLRRHLREESQIILLRNVVNDTFTTEMRTAHANSEIFEGKKKEDIFTAVKSKAVTHLLNNYNENLTRFVGQAPTEHINHAQAIFDKFVS